MLGCKAERRLLRGQLEFMTNTTQAVHFMPSVRLSDTVTSGDIQRQRNRHDS